MVNKILHSFRLLLVMGLIFLGLFIVTGAISAQPHNNNLVQSSDNLTVTIDPKGGLYDTPKVVKITLNQPGTIYYTLDGSDPLVAGIKYRDRIYIGKTSILKYYAISSNGTSTPVYSEQYTIDTIQPNISVSLIGGWYNADKNIYLSSDKPCTIYYTVDGSIPDKSSLIYNGPIFINHNTILRYFAIDLAGNPIKTYNYKYGI